MKGTFLLVSIFSIIDVYVQVKPVPVEFCWSPKHDPAFAIFPDIDRGVADNYRLWDAGSTITVKFLNGSESLQRNVFEIGQKWQAFANIRFLKTAGHENANIRVMFTNGSGHNSYLGTNANLVHRNYPTLWIDTASFLDQKIAQAAVLHMFGHVLGLEHETLPEDEKINWNKSLVKGQLARAKAFFNASDENSFMELRYDLLFGRNSTSSWVDANSIMLMPYHQSILNNGASRSLKSGLSDQDKRLVSLLYPRTGRRGVAVSLDLNARNFTRSIVDSIYQFDFDADLRVSGSCEVYVVLYMLDENNNWINDIDHLYNMRGNIAAYMRLRFPEALNVDTSIKFHLILPMKEFTSGCMPSNFQIAVYEFNNWHSKFEEVYFSSPLKLKN